MKRKTREEKGITLIALIITIVVLLILAVVAINAVTGDGIIQHATNAKTEYEDAQEKEQDTLSYYGDYLAVKGNYGPWKESGDNIVMKDAEGKEVKIALGSEVTYVPVAGKTYTSPSSTTGADEDQVFTVSGTETSWKVIGVENGKVILLATDLIVPTVDGEEQSRYIFTGLNKPTKGAEELNKICSIYKDEKVVDSARSVNREDLLHLCNVTDEEIIYTDIFSVGDKYTYIYGDSNNDGVDDSIMFKVNNGNYETMARQEILLPDGTKIDSTNKGPRTVLSQHASVDFKDNKFKSIVLYDSEGYWLATDNFAVCKRNVGTSYIRGDYIYALEFIAINIAPATGSDIGKATMYNSKDGAWGALESVVAKVRPVVVLKTDTQLIEDGTDSAGNVKYKVVQ